MAEYPDQDVITALVAGYYADLFSLIGNASHLGGLVDKGEEGPLNYIFKLGGPA